jgi:hypothetical protein
MESRLTFKRILSILIYFTKRGADDEGAAKLPKCLAGERCITSLLVSVLHYFSRRSPGKVTKLMKQGASRVVENDFLLRISIV